MLNWQNLGKLYVEHIKKEKFMTIQVFDNKVKRITIPENRKRHGTRGKNEETKKKSV